MAAPIRFRAAGQSRCGSVTMSLGKGYLAYSVSTNASHSSYSAATAPGPRRSRWRAQRLFSTKVTFRSLASSPRLS